MIPEAAVEAAAKHLLHFTDDGWICSGCDWASDTAADFWTAHTIYAGNVK